MSKFKSTAISRALRVAMGAAMVTGLVYGGVVKAADATSNLSATADVINNCSISTSPIAFGNYDPAVANAAAALDATGTVTVTCTMGAAATVKLGQGSNADTGSTDAAPVRRLANGINFLSYQIYSDTGRITVWGNEATSDVDHTGTGELANLTVYGRIAAGQVTAPAGPYTDTVVATVTF